MTTALRSFYAGSTVVLRSLHAGSAVLRSTIVLLLVCGGPALAQQSPGVVGEVRVHGNHTTPDADVLAIIGDVAGKPATDALIADITGRIRQSGRFDGVEVRKRLRSIDNPDDILLMVIVDEVPGIEPGDLTPGPLKRLRASGMFLPVLHSEDGYGFTYGMRMSFVDRFGARSRISVPLTWGGERQARVQLEKTLASGPIDRIIGDAGIGRRENPHYRIGDTRVSLGGRIESAPRQWLRLGAGARRDAIRYDDAEDTVGRLGADVTLDTRVDPAFPRNAVHAIFATERVSFATGHARQNTADVRGYVGLLGQSVVAVRALSVTSNAVLPIYEHPLLGGAANLRGYEAGYKAGDNLFATSVELRVPVTSPLSVGRFGVKAFVDWGTVYGAGEKLRDQHLDDRGIGGGAYLQLTLLSISLDVARSRAGDVRYHFGLGVTFR